MDSECQFHDISGPKKQFSVPLFSSIQYPFLEESSHLVTNFRLISGISWDTTPRGCHCGDQKGFWSTSPHFHRQICPILGIKHKIGQRSNCNPTPRKISTPPFYGPKESLISTNLLEPWFLGGVECEWGNRLLAPTRKIQPCSSEAL